MRPGYSRPSPPATANSSTWLIAVDLEPISFSLACVPGRVTWMKVSTSSSITIDPWSPCTWSGRTGRDRRPSWRAARRGTARTQRRSPPRHPRRDVLVRQPRRVRVDVDGLADGQISRSTCARPGSSAPHRRRDPTCRASRRSRSSPGCATTRPTPPRRSAGRAARHDRVPDGHAGRVEAVLADHGTTWPRSTAAAAGAPDSSAGGQARLEGLLHTTCRPGASGLRRRRRASRSACNGRCPPWPKPARHGRTPAPRSAAMPAGARRGRVDDRGDLTGGERVIARP